MDLNLARVWLRLSNNNSSGGSFGQYASKGFLENAPSTETTAVHSSQPRLIVSLPKPTYLGSCSCGFRMGLPFGGEPLACAKSVRRWSACGESRAMGTAARFSAASGVSARSGVDGGDGDCDRAIQARAELLAAGCYIRVAVLELVD